MLTPEGRQYIVSSLDRAGLPPADVYASGQHVPYLYAPDRWGGLRYNHGVGFMLSWAEPHVQDYRYRYRDDDFCVDVCPEVDAPWRFPDHVYMVSAPAADGYDGWLIEPAYCDPDPTRPPSGVLYKIDEPGLPEYGIRVVQASGCFARAVTWGPEHNIAADRVLMCAPLQWQGYQTNTIGEQWELQGYPVWSLRGYDTTGVSGVFPVDPTMPHGDPEPLWNDGLDAERLIQQIKNRKLGAPRRGSSDKFIALWGDLIQTSQLETILDGSGKLNITRIGTPYGTPAWLSYIIAGHLAGRTDYRDTNEAPRWADPAHFGQVNSHNYPRLMHKCLFCFNAHLCKSGNNPSDGEQHMCVGTLGFRRNHYVDVPASFNPSGVLGALYADSYCMYSTRTAYDKNFPVVQRDDESFDDFLKRYDNTSDLCHVNGMPRRAVEYDGHYRLLLEEVYQPLFTHIDELIYIHTHPAAETSMAWGAQTFQVERMPTTDYEGNTLYRIIVPGAYPDELEIGQYAAHYCGLVDQVLCWYSIKWNPVFQRYVVAHVWAYIWYVSAHANRAARVQIRRLVELKHDYGRYYGNITEGRTVGKFAGGSSDLEPLPDDRFSTQDDDGNPSMECVWRPTWVKEGGQWIKKQQGIDLVSAYWNSYRTDVGARASGVISVVAQPGEVIPDTFLAYTEPKMITWGKSKTDPNTQTHTGSTPWHYDWRTGKWTRATGDVDDLYYHLQYSDNAPGAMSSYLEDVPPGMGYYASFTSPSGTLLNTGETQVRIASPLLAPSDVAVVTTTEANELCDTDLILKSDLQHARNLTAPIFAFDLTTQIPLHHVVRPDLQLTQTDWCTRTEEPFEVMAQREYAATPPIWCFAKNTTDREMWYPRMMEYEDGTRERVQVWMPEGRVWWHRKGLLGTMREWTPGGDNFTMTGVAVINMWRRYVPHHMQVARAYIWLEPVTDPYNTEDYHGTKFKPFGSMSALATDTSSKAQEIDWCKRRAQMFADTPGRNQSQYPVPIEEQWAEIKEASHKLLGAWELGGQDTIRWTNPGESTEDWSEYDINHKYIHAAYQNDYHIARGLRLTVNGQAVRSMDKQNPDTFAQRNLDWYNTLSVLYQDGGFARLDDEGAVDTTTYYRNSNRYTDLNTNFDCGEMEYGAPDQTGKAYGYAASGGGRKAPFIFDVTAQVREAYNDRMDVEFVTVVDPQALERQHTAAAVKSPNTNINYILKVLSSNSKEFINSTLISNILNGTRINNNINSLSIGLSTGNNFALFAIYMLPPSTVKETSTIRISSRVKDSKVWHTLLDWHATSGEAFSVTAFNRLCKYKPTICAELRIEVTDVDGIKLTDIEYVGDISKLPITGPAATEQFNQSSAISTGTYPNEIWSMPLKEVPCAIQSVMVTDTDGIQELQYAGEQPRFAFYIAPHEKTATDPFKYYWYDPIDNAVIVVKSSRLVSLSRGQFICDVEYVSRAGATAMVAVEAVVAGPTHDIDPEAICMIHPDDLARLETNPAIPWAVLNPDELEGGYQYWEPEYKDLIVEDTLAKNPGITDPYADPAYAGRGINYVKLGSMPDAFGKDETNYRKYWAQEGADVLQLVPNTWKTKARGYVKFYGPPNTLIPKGIRVIAPAYVKYRDPLTQAGIDTTEPQAGALVPRIPNGGMKPAPLILELKMDDGDYPAGQAARKTAAFRPHLLIYLRENTTFLGGTYWKETGGGYGASSEITGEANW